MACQQPLHHTLACFCIYIAMLNKFTRDNVKFISNYEIDKRFCNIIYEFFNTYHRPFHRTAFIV